MLTVVTAEGCIERFNNGHWFLKANMCGQEIGYNKMVCPRKSGSAACGDHAWQPRRHLVPLGQIHADTQWVGFTTSPKNIKVLTPTSHYLVLGTDSAFPSLSCFRVPDLDGACLYAVACDRRIIRLQKDDVIVRQTHKLCAGDGWPVHEDCANMLVRAAPHDQQHPILCLAFHRHPRNLRQWLKSCFIRTGVPPWMKALHFPLLKV